MPLLRLKPRTRPRTSGPTYLPKHERLPGWKQSGLELRDSLLRRPSSSKNNRLQRRRERPRLNSCACSTRKKTPRERLLARQKLRLKKRGCSPPGKPPTLRLQT